MEYKLTDEGLECDIEIGGFQDVTVVFIETYTEKKECEIWIDEIKKHYHNSIKDLDTQAANYVSRIYREKLAKYTLEYVYIDLEDKMGTFGLMYRLENDTEHGLGVKFEDFKIKKVGPAETAFLGL